MKARIGHVESFGGGGSLLQGLVATERETRKISTMDRFTDFSKRAESINVFRFTYDEIAARAIAAWKNVKRQEIF
jgi:hypothetical protein